MPTTFIRKVAGLELEEKIFHAAVALTMLSVFFPWFSGRWIGSDMRSYSGFGFYTSFIGFGIFFLCAYQLAFGLAPLTGSGRLLAREREDGVRLWCSAACAVASLCALSVLINVTFEFQAMELRFGIGTALFGSLAQLFYAFLLWQERTRSLVKESFGVQNHTSSAKTAQEVKEETSQKLLEHATEIERRFASMSAHRIPPPPPIDHSAPFRR